MRLLEPGSQPLTRKGDGAQQMQDFGLVKGRAGWKCDAPAHWSTPCPYSLVREGGDDVHLHAFPRAPPWI